MWSPGLWLQRVGLSSPFGAAPPYWVLCWLSHNQGPFVNTQRQNSIVAEAQLLVLADPGLIPHLACFGCDWVLHLTFLWCDWNVKC